MNFKTFSVAAAIIIMSACYGLGQKRTITEKQYDDADSAAWKFLENHSYRSRETRERAGRPGPTLTFTIYESVPPRQSRTLATEKVDGVTTTTETIKSANKIFLRKNGGKWTLQDSGSDRFTVSGMRVKDERVTEFTMTPDVMLGNEKTDLYEQNETITYNSTAVTLTNSWTRRFWLDQKGARLKSEYIFKRGDGGIMERSTTFYEYDPNIRIEIPVTK
jgi:hypothetical protein